MPRQASATGADPYRGRKIARYEILTRLSVGGMAELFLAFTSGPGGFRKFVALKQILPDVKTDEFVKMFLDEARITAAFSHPNIGQVFELGQDDDELYLAMEFLPGQNLEQVLIAASRLRPLPVGFAARVARDVCLGLHYAHHFTAPSGRRVAVVHRDMAPRNVMITYDGVVKVIDFGIAKAKGRIARTRVGMVKGTSGYMSPEQVRGQDLDGRSDLFTTGVLLHEMLCGQRLFDTSDEDAMMRQIANADIPPPRSINPDVPEALDAVVMRALVKDPARRFATGREMAKAIEVAMGPEIFDEEAVAELMQSLFAEKRLKTLALLDYASHDDERVSDIVEALQEKTIGEAPEPEREPAEAAATDPMRALPHLEPAARPAPRRASAGARLSQRKQASGGDPPRARPFPAQARLGSEAALRREQLVDDDAPTQVGIVRGAPERSPEPEPRESRRPPKMGIYTLGPVAPKAPAEPRSIPEDSETVETSLVSEVSRVSRVSMALTALHRPARRTLWLIGAMVLAGLAVLFMPASLRSRLGAWFTSAGQSASQQLAPPPEPQAAPPPAPAPTAPSPAAPPADAYEPPPPAEEHGAQQARPEQESPTPAKDSQPASPTRSVTKPGGIPKKAPKAAAVAPAKKPDAPPSPSVETPAIQDKSEGQEGAAPAEEAPEPIEPSTGPAEVDPSIQPLELSPPSTSGEGL
ncbi:MAG: serine/threonine protein kinase [Myxococcaceae bacterium]|nr:serine/threonine protein kinase [Myxococcaceae bacterium]